MGLQFVVQEAKFIPLPEDEFFRARLERIELREFDFTDKKTGEKKNASNLEWTFEITAEGEYKGRKVRGRTSSDLTVDESNRFRTWAETLLGRALPIGMGIDEDDLVGLSCELTVRHEADRKDPAKKWERVDEILPLSRRPAVLQLRPALLAAAPDPGGMRSGGPADRTANSPGGGKPQGVARAVIAESDG
jgi:hypothetical protein